MKAEGDVVASTKEAEQAGQQLIKERETLAEKIQKLKVSFKNLPSRIVKHCLTKEYFNSFTLRLSTFNVNNDLYPYTWSITF